MRKRHGTVADSSAKQKDAKQISPECKVEVYHIYGVCCLFVFVKLI